MTCLEQWILKSQLFYSSDRDLSNQSHWDAMKLPTWRIIPLSHWMSLVSRLVTTIHNPVPFEIHDAGDHPTSGPSLVQRKFTGFGSVGQEGFPRVLPSCDLEKNKGQLPAERLRHLWTNRRVHWGRFQWHDRTEKGKVWCDMLWPRDLGKTKKSRNILHNGKHMENVTVQQKRG